MDTTEFKVVLTELIEICKIPEISSSSSQ